MDETFSCYDNAVTTVEPLPHLWICCGFEKLPTSLTVDWALEGTDPDCLAQYGASGTSTFTRSICGSNYTNASLPFYISVPNPAYCSGSPNETNSHISSWGMGPGAPIYDPDNACIRDPNTGDVTFSLCATNVGTDCTFTVCVTGAS